MGRKLTPLAQPEEVALLGAPQASRPHLAHMIGKAACGLVTFHLSRRGFDCVATTDNCGRGDLWAALNERLQAIEVKGSIDTHWHLRSGQMDKVDLYAFVDISNGRCWLVPAKNVLEFCSINALRDRDVISLQQVETLGGIRLDIGFRAIRQMVPTEARKSRVVRKRLADGTEREYRYPRWQKKGGYIRA